MTAKMSALGRKREMNQNKKYEFRQLRPRALEDLSSAHDGHFNGSTEIQQELTSALSQRPLFLSGRAEPSFLQRRELRKER